MSAAPAVKTKYPTLTPEEVGDKIWSEKHKHSSDKTREDACKRMVTALCAKEMTGLKKDDYVFTHSPTQRRDEVFFEILKEQWFLPAGRIVSNLGSGREKVTTFNCAVMPQIPDSLDGIFEVLKMSALTQKAGAGVGYDFSGIRPSGTNVKGVESPASGPVSFMEIFDSACKSIMSAGARRGANMAVLRIDHPDIETFITVKSREGVLEKFNLSVAVTDEFLEALRTKQPFPLRFNGKVYREVDPEKLWDLLMQSAYDWGEPGVLFVDTINSRNNLQYCEMIGACNPCGEVPAPPFGVCLLGSVNLAKMVTVAEGGVLFAPDPNSPSGYTLGSLDWERLNRTVEAAVVFLDDVIDHSKFPLKEQADFAKATRRMGLGVTGFADMLRMIGIPYGSPEAVGMASMVSCSIARTAYMTSSALAKVRGSFPSFDVEKFCQSSNVLKSLGKGVEDSVRSSGLRNSHLLSIAPTGTISLAAGNVSSGIEPVFSEEFDRKFRTENDGEEWFHVIDNAAFTFRTQNPSAKFPVWFDTVDDLSPQQHIDIVAAFQEYVDQGISKTINVPGEYPYDTFKKIFLEAHAKGLKGCTCYRPGGKRKGILVKEKDKEEPVPTEAPFERPEALTGRTYKIRDGADKAFYVTINDVEGPDGPRPYEIFINTKDLEHVACLTTITRLMSAVFRKEKDPSFLIDELKCVVSPSGGYWLKGKGFCPSFQAHLAMVLENHLQGLKKGPKKKKPSGTVVSGWSKLCPECFQPLMKVENCEKCPACGYAGKCG